MEARIAALLDEKDVMLGAIGHDLKTPLAALRVRIESVEDPAERAKMAASIEDITRSLDDILSLARVGRPSDPLERTDLSALRRRGGRGIRGHGRAGRARRHATPRAAAARHLAAPRAAQPDRQRDPLRPARRASRWPAKVNDAVVRIEDDGPGIPEGDIAAMMEPFARGEASRNRETGGAGPRPDAGPRDRRAARRHA